MRDFFNSKGISYTPVAFEKADEVVAAYDAGRCDTYTLLTNQVLLHKELK